MRRKSDNRPRGVRKTNSKTKKTPLFMTAKVTPLSTNKTGQIVDAGGELDADQVERRRRRPQLLQERGRVQDFGNF